MDEFVFNNVNVNNFPEVLKKTVVRISIYLRQRGEPSSLTLWHSENRGIKIASNMYDINERTEVGTLVFEAAEFLSPEEVVVQEIEMFSNVMELRKLIIMESGVSIESGLVLEFSGQKTVTIVAGVSPYSIAVSGVIDTPHIFEPAYHIEDYLVREF